MSLSSFLDNNKDVRERLLAEFVKPEFREKSLLKAPPLVESGLAGLAGTAFDYLAR